jgi:2-oxo-4-hydroxy-4-carboxy--5-ureidoimidazoline (OHCU) decarboxylase
VSTLPPLTELNSLPREQFALALGPLFEIAIPLADALYARRPFTSYPLLIDTAESLAQAMPLAQQVAILAAHPRIGAPQQTLSDASRREQGYGTQPADDVIAQLAVLNQQYEDRFGFRFVVFVNKRPRSEIVEVLRERLTRSRDEELQTGLGAMFAIARDRLAAA